MATEVIGIDHVYFTVSDLATSERWYDTVLVEVFGFRKIAAALGGDPHVHYYNRQFGVSIRPARSRGAAGSGAAANTPAPHDAYSPGLHHFCLRVEDAAAVDSCARALLARSIAITEPALYPEYDVDYYAIFLADPDGIRLEVTNFRKRRRERMYDWDNS